MYLCPSTDSPATFEVDGEGNVIENEPAPNFLTVVAMMSIPFSVAILVVGFALLVAIVRACGGALSYAVGSTQRRRRACA